MAWVTRDDNGIWNLHGTKPTKKNSFGRWNLLRGDSYFSYPSRIFFNIKLKPGEGPVQVELVRKVTKRKAKK